MITIYTGAKFKEVEKIDVDFVFPENGSAPYEQWQWVEDIVNRYINDENYKNISIKTFSPYILAAFNIFIAKYNWTPNDIKVSYMYEGKPQDILAFEIDDDKVTRKNYAIDIYDLVEPMEDITHIYMEEDKKRRNK